MFLFTNFSLQITLTCLFAFGSKVCLSFKFKPKKTGIHIPELPPTLLPQPSRNTDGLHAGSFHKKPAINNITHPGHGSESNRSLRCYPAATATVILWLPLSPIGIWQHYLRRWLDFQFTSLRDWRYCWLIYGWSAYVDCTLRNLRKQRNRQY